MQYPINGAEDLAAILRATRKGARMRIDDLASTAGLSKQFVGDVESAKPTVQLGLVIKLLSELGVHMYVDVPKDAIVELDTHRKHVKKRITQRVDKQISRKRPNPTPRGVD